MPQTVTDDEPRQRRLMRIIGAAALGLIALVLLFGSFFTVEQGARAVVTRFGAVVRVAEPGAHLKLPLIESVTDVNTRTQTIEWLSGHDEGKKSFDSRMESYSRDQQPAHIGLKLTYHVKPDEHSISLLFSQYRNADGYENAVLLPRTYEAVKTIFGQFTAVRAIQERATFNVEVDKELRRLVDGTESPIVIDGVQIQDIAFSQAYENAVEARMQAQVEVEKVTQNLERERKSAEIAVVQAKAEADSSLAKAEAEAKAIRLRGDAEAAAIRARSEALRDSPRLVDLTLAEKWNGVLPTTMVPGQAVPFVSVK